MSETTSPSTNAALLIGGIVGGVLGFAVLIGVAVIFIVHCRRKQGKGNNNGIGAIGTQRQQYGDLPLKQYDDIGDVRIKHKL